VLAKKNKIIWYNIGVKFLYTFEKYENALSKRKSLGSFAAH